MTQQSFTVERGARVVLNGCEGDLIATSHEEPTITITTDAEVAARREGNTITIEGARVPLQIHLPSDAAIEVRNQQGGVRVEGSNDVLVERAGSVLLRNVTGNVHVRDVETLRVEGEVRFSGQREEWQRGKGNVLVERVGKVFVENVRANLDLHDCGALAGGNVGGNCTVRTIDGDLALENIGGSCLVEQVRGTLRLQNVGGNAELHGIGAVQVVGNVGGNLVLRDTALVLGADAELGIAVGGNARVLLPAEANVTLQAVAGGMVNVEGSGRNQHMATAVYGEGAAKLKIMAGGNVELSGGNPQVTGMGWGDMIGFGGTIGRSVGQGISAAVSALRHSSGDEERAQRVWQQVETRVRQQGPSDDDSARDRMAILQMVAEKRISAEDGAKLLEALRMH